MIKVVGGVLGALYCVLNVLEVVCGVLGALYCVRCIRGGMWCFRCAILC